MRTETIKLYKFEELSKEAKEKAIEEHSEINTDYEWWDFLLEDFSERLKAIGIGCKDFFFDFYRERYFKMDNADIVDKNLLLEKADCLKYLIPYSLDDEEKAVYFNISINDKDYENLMKVEVEADYDRDYFDDEEQDKILEIAEEMSGVLQEFIDDLCGEFLKELEKEQEYLFSNEAISETLIANDYEFTKKGERY